MKRVLSIIAVGAMTMFGSQAMAQVDRSFHAGAFVADDGAGNSVKLSVSGTGNHVISIPAGADATVLLTTGGQTIGGALNINGAVTLGGLSATPGLVRSGVGGLLSSSPLTGADFSAGSISNTALQNSGVTLSNGTGVSITGGSLSLGGTATISIGQDVATTATPTFAGMTLSGVSNGVAHVASGVISGSPIVDADITNATITNAKLANAGVTLSNGTGVTVTGGSLSLGGSATISIGQDVAPTATPTFAGATFNGKPTATATVAGDGSTTLTTKGYVDAASGASLTNAVILAPGSSTRNVVQSTGDFTPLVVKAATGQTTDLVDFLPSASATPVASITTAGAATFSSLSTGSGAITGGAIGGSSVSATGAVSGASVAASGAVTGASVAASGAVTGASVAATGAVTGASVTATGAVQGATVNVTGNITGSGVGKFAGKISVAGVNTVTIPAPNVTSASTVILTYENTSSPNVGGAPGFFISSYDNTAHTFTVVLLSNGPVGSSLNYMVIN